MGRGKNAWNEIVTYLSAGMLYGHEVKRPEWYVEERRCAYSPRINRAPSARRMQIETMLREGMGITETARELGLRRLTVQWYCTQIYRRHGVKRLAELWKKWGVVRRGDVSEYKREGASVFALGASLCYDGKR